MNNETILVGVRAFVPLGIRASSVFLLSPLAGLRDPAYDKPYSPAPEVSLTQDNGSTFRQVTDPTPETGYGIDHTTRVTPVEDYVHNLKLLLK